MNALEDAKELLIMAEKDIRALKGMMDADIFTDEVFGFHAQQAVEKTLKAWIASLGEEHTYKHDIRPLLIILEDLKCDVADLWELV